MSVIPRSGISRLGLIIGLSCFIPDDSGTFPVSVIPASSHPTKAQDRLNLTFLSGI